MIQTDNPLRNKLEEGCLGGSVVYELESWFGSGHDLTVREFNSHIGLCAESVEPAWDSFSLSLSLSVPPRPQKRKKHGGLVKEITVA